MKAVVFDMDGLMFDTERVFVEAWDYAGEKCGIGKAGYMTIKTLGMNVEMSNSIWKEEFGIDYNTSDIRKFSKEFLLDYYANNIVPVKKGLFDLITYLKTKGYKIAVASSSPTREVEKHLKSTKIYNEFDAIVCGDMVSKSKPQPDIYLKACKKLGESPCDCYAIEDSKNGILSATEAGCKAIMVPDLWEPDDQIKNILHGLFKDLDEVRDYLVSLEI